MEYLCCFFFWSVFSEETKNVGTVGCILVCKIIGAYGEGRSCRCGSLNYNVIYVLWPTSTKS